MINEENTKTFQENLERKYTKDLIDSKNQLEEDQLQNLIKNLDEADKYQDNNIKDRKVYVKDKFNLNQLQKNKNELLY